jgi:signal peptidase I
MSDDRSGREGEAGDPEPPSPRNEPTDASAARERARDPFAAFEPPRFGEPPREPAQVDGDEMPPTDAGPHDDAAMQPYIAREDPYADVPASLELAYTSADLGLGPNAYERAFPYERRQRHVSGQRMRRIGRELVETVILAVLIFFAVKAVIQNFRVDGASMEPSLHNEQYLLVNKAIYFRVDMDRIHDFLPFVPEDNGNDRHLFRAPRRGDVIVFRFHLQPDRDFIKRVIGVPGDTVEVKDGAVFINGAPLQEDYIMNTPNYTYGPRTVPEGHYFVLGDNRRNSSDSHAWATQCSPEQNCDFVPEENIIGQAWLTYWPFDDLGLINNKTLKPTAP